VRSFKNVALLIHAYFGLHSVGVGFRIAGLESELFVFVAPAQCNARYHDGRDPHAFKC
jgi:hypothetical protein